MTGKEVRLVPISRTVIGYPEQLAVALETARKAGRLASWGEPYQLTESSRRVAVDVTLLEDAQPAPRNWRPYVIGAVTVAGSMAGGALVWAVVWVANWIGAHLQQIATGAVVALIVLAAIMGLISHVRGHVCTGIHCPGCRG